MPNRLQEMQLEKLLTSWGCKALIKLFEDEEIFIEELEMMKLHHLHELLRNFKMGLRIRFEYHFEKWRRSIDKPLQIGCVGLNKEFVPKLINAPIQEQRAVKAPAASNATANTSSNHGTTSSNKPLIESEALCTEKPVTPTIKTILPKFALAGTKEAFIDSGITVLNILKESGFRGQALLDYYEEHQSITPLQRQLLVKLICTYFDDRNYHMALKTSHILEQQIIELFPSEKIENYRADKSSSGKLYNGLKNLKRRANYFPANNQTKTNNSKKAKNAAETSSDLENRDNDDNFELNENQQESNLDYFTIAESNDSHIKIEYTSD